jgi:hypothetical protein
MAETDTASKPKAEAGKSDSWVKKHKTVLIVAGVAGALLIVFLLLRHKKTGATSSTANLSTVNPNVGGSSAGIAGPQGPAGPPGPRGKQGKTGGSPHPHICPPGYVWESTGGGATGGALPIGSGGHCVKDPGHGTHHKHHGKSDHDHGDKVKKG